MCAHKSLSKIPSRWIIGRLKMLIISTSGWRCKGGGRGKRKKKNKNRLCSETSTKVGLPSHNVNKKKKKNNNNNKGHSWRSVTDQEVLTLAQHGATLGQGCHRASTFLTTLKNNDHTKSVAKIFFVILFFCCCSSSWDKVWCHLADVLGACWTRRDF